MARSLSNAKVFFSVVADNISIAVTRRGFAAAAQGVAAMERGGSRRMGKTAQDEIGRSGENSWVPDPVTGYYRPANRAEEVDVAELREIFLRQKVSPQ